MVSALNLDFWRGRRVFLTGHTGFKGAWLAFCLHELGAQVRGFALPPATEPSLYAALRLDMASQYADIRDAQAVAHAVTDFQPEIVFHLAAQALVRPSYADPLATFSSNIMGTAHVLDALRGVASVKSVVCVTTDKVYRNRESMQPYCEEDELGGHDPYSASKAASELVIASYRDAYLIEQGVGVAAVRAGNVIGGGDWSPERLLPDAVFAWQSGQVLHIRRPDAVRPWQHVLEPVLAYLLLAQQMWDAPELGRAWNIGPNGGATVREVVHIARAVYGVGEVVWAECQSGLHEAGLLSLDASLAQRVLGVRPRWDLEQAVTRSMHWYRDFAQGGLAHELCARDWQAYCKN